VEENRAHTHVCGSKWTRPAGTRKIINNNNNNNNDDVFRLTVAAAPLRCVATGRTTDRVAADDDDDAPRGALETFLLIESRDVYVVQFHLSYRRVSKTVDVGIWPASGLN